MRCGRRWRGERRCCNRQRCCAAFTARRSREYDSCAMAMSGKVAFLKHVQSTQGDVMNAEEYRSAFAEPEDRERPEREADTRAGRALALALDIRKFEIDLYWKRATYFWAFIAAAFAGYALTYRAGTTHEPWLSLLFSSLGLVFSFAWYLANRGSKFWQNNWERHVDLLEDMTLGPLYKVVAITPEKNPLTAAGPFSVTKINQMLSLFVTAVWLLLLIKEVGPIGPSRELDCSKLAIVATTVAAIVALAGYGRSRIGHGASKLTPRSFTIET
jgi:hypothetical protein